MDFRVAGFPMLKEVCIITQNEFKQVFEQQVDRCRVLLMRKTKEYTGNNADRLSAFKAGIGHDSAGYLTPQGLRNVLIISATPYQWKHMIGQRVCRRNTDETRLVMLMIWQELYRLSPILFAPELTGPFCQCGQCAESKISCGQPIQREMLPPDILLADYPLLRKEAAIENQAD